MSNCIKCGTTLVPGAVYCHLCGKKQVTERRKALKRANGTGTVYKLAGRRKSPWVAAKNKVIIGHYERKTDALDALERLNGKSLTERYNMTFAEIFDAWKEEHYKEIGKQGIESYNNAYRIFTPLHGKKFRDLRTADFQAVLDPQKPFHREQVQTAHNADVELGNPGGNLHNKFCKVCPAAGECQKRKGHLHGGRYP